MADSARALIRDLDKQNRRQFECILDLLRALERIAASENSPMAGEWCRAVAKAALAKAAADAPKAEEVSHG